MNLLKRHLSLLALAALCLGCSLGCSKPQSTHLELVTYDASRERHYADFPEAYFARHAGGMLELLFITEQPSTLDPTQSIQQVVYIKEFWNPRPGQTYVNGTQTNATVQYAMLTPPTGVRYDGGVFLTYKEDGDKMVGWIESGNLQPRFRMGGAVEPFGAATFEGEFCARENSGRISEMRHLLETQFKPTVSQR